MLNTHIATGNQVFDIHRFIHLLLSRKNTRRITFEYSMSYVSVYQPYKSGWVLPFIATARGGRHNWFEPRKSTCTKIISLRDTLNSRDQFIFTRLESFRFGDVTCDPGCVVWCRYKKNRRRCLLPKAGPSRLSQENIWKINLLCVYSSPFVLLLCQDIRQNFTFVGCFGWWHGVINFLSKVSQVKEKILQIVVSSSFLVSRMILGV